MVIVGFVVLHVDAVLNLYWIVPFDPPLTPILWAFPSYAPLYALVVGHVGFAHPTVTVKVTLDEVVTKEITGVNVNTTNLGAGLKVQALKASDSIITVIVKGSPSVVNNVQASSIRGYIDLDGLGVGEHEVEVKVTGDDTRLQYTPRVKKIKVKITK